MPKLFSALVTKPIHEDGLAVLQRACRRVTVLPGGQPLPKEELIRRLKGHDGVLCMLTDKIDREVLDAAARAGVKGFANLAVGTDNFDISYAVQLGIRLSNTPGVLTEATAELAWALLFAAARRVVEGDRFTREGRFTGWEPNMLLGWGISGRTLGIVGAGRIGGAMARMSRGFGMKVLYVSPSRKPDLEQETGARKVGLKTLLRQSDFVSIHCPLTPATRHLLGEAELRMMKPSAILINTGRGPVVDEAALVKALRKGWIAGAGLDVYEGEPRIEKGLVALDNAVLLPHIGSATHATRARMAVMAAENLVAMMRGKTPKNPIGVK